MTISHLTEPAPRVDGARDAAHDFDFLHGTWHVHNRRLRRPLAGSTEWYAFDGHAIERPLWDGRANIEEYDATLPDGTRLRGLALRLFEPATRRWTIHWSSGTLGTLDAPMTGTFDDGVGEFHGRDTHDGREIHVRFRWTPASASAARWEQAFSIDDGRTWETNWVMDFTRVDATSCCSIVELRQYDMRPGARDTLIDLFEREFIESQEATGIQVIAQFRDIDRPDVFLWLRGFPDMPARAASLGAFYDGPVWARHRDAANGTMLSSDDVLLLRPVRPGSGFSFADPRPAPGATTIPDDLVVATVYTLVPDAVAEFPELFAHTIEPRLTAAGARLLATLETEPSANTFPRLPVREGEHTFVTFARFADLATYDRHLASLSTDRAWHDEIEPAIARHLAAPTAIYRLTPTARSRALR